MLSFFHWQKKKKGKKRGKLYFQSGFVKLFLPYQKRPQVKNAPAESQLFQGKEGLLKSEWLPHSQDPLKVLMKSVTLASQLYVSIHNPSQKNLTVEPPTTPMAFPACVRLGLHWFLVQSRVTLSTWKAFALLYLPGLSGQLSENTESTVSGPHSQTVFLLLCANNIDIVDHTRIRWGSTISPVVYFSSTEVSEWWICVALSITCSYQCPILFKTGVSTCKWPQKPLQWRHSQSFTVWSSVSFLCALAWPFSHTWSDLLFLHCGQLCLCPGKCQSALIYHGLPVGQINIYSEPLD